MQNRPPFSEAPGTPGWENWFTQVFLCLPWRQAFNITKTLDFGNVAANSQSTGLDITVTGARQGDAVTITPYTETSGIDYKAVVSGNDTVTAYAINFTAGAINPASMVYRVIVIQN
jgi:hypothetical protein